MGFVPVRGTHIGAGQDRLKLTDFREEIKGLLTHTATEAKLALAVDFSVNGLVKSQTPSATLIPRIVELLGEAEELVGPEADYTQIAQLLEDRAGFTLG